MGILIGGVIIGILLLLAAFLQWSRKSIKITTYSYSDSRLPQALYGLRIVHLSDLQSEYFGKEQCRILAKTAAEKPDLIVFTGDLVDRNHTNYEAGFTLMKGLTKIAPVYYVDGNHELALPQEEISQMNDGLRQMGVHLLLNSGERFSYGQGQLYLMGISEETLYRAKVIGGALQEGQMSSRGKVSDTDVDEKVIVDALETLNGALPEGAFSILLVHEPQFLEIYESSKAALLCAGHAHGGQIRLPFTQGLFAPGQGVLPKLTSGMHRSGASTMVISRGLGNSTFPFRVFNRPEIVVITLKPPA